MSYVRAFLLISAIILSQVVLFKALAVEDPSKADKPEAAVLSPDKYVGKAQLGYQAAKEVPDICAKLFCYCGCDLTDSHSTLLDCFTCDHGVDCSICQDEAIIARDLKQQGKSLSEIQYTIDDAFQTQYPWEKPSPALEKYRASISKTPTSVPTEKKKKGDKHSTDSTSAGQRTRKGCCGQNHG